jgi:cysteine desulfurase/selenocysteine lyase
MDVDRVRKDFPIYDKDPDGTIYLDSACQSLRPRQVIDAMDQYYESFPACGGRSVHRLASQVAIKVDESREAIARFIGAERDTEIVFTKSCTEALNMVAFGLDLKRDDVVVTTDIEHNSNHVPWLELKERKGVGRRFARSTVDGRFDMESFKSVMDRNVKVVSMVQTNNVNGATIPIKEIAEVAHDHGAIMVVDGAQSAPHMRVDMKGMDIDFFGMSLHKMLGPSGMGVLYGRMEDLEGLRPLMSGGGSVLETGYDHARYLPPPEKFEAGLLNYAGIIGSGAAVEYLRKLGMDDVNEHERRLNRSMTTGLRHLEEVRVLEPLDPDLRGSIYPFNVKGLSSHDVAMFLDEIGHVMIRSGSHCSHPYFSSLGLDGCARASTYVYNTMGDAKRFVESVEKLVEVFAS